MLRGEVQSAGFQHRLDGGTGGARQHLGTAQQIENGLYDAFGSRPLNSAPVDAITTNTTLLLQRNAQAAPWAALSNSLPLGRTDAVPQRQLDAILWKSVHGAGSVPPPPGPMMRHW